MKLWLALAGAAMVVFAWLALRPPSDGLAPMTLLQATSGPPQASVARIPAAEPPAPRGIRVHGVLFRGETAAASQALLSIEGKAAHVFQVGEPVAQGWSLASVAPDHVVLSHGGARARLDVTYSVQSPPAETPVAAPVMTVAAHRAAVAAERAGIKEEPAPGLAPAGAGQRPVQRGPATLEANRKFMQDMQGRLGQGR